MFYTYFSLNGTWQMGYSENIYLSKQKPEFKGYTIRNAVPGYWEDMTDRFAREEFYRSLRINPEHGLWQYPIAQYCPDMALPNIMGNFFYTRTFLCEGVKDSAVLHFGGVHNAVSVWLNGEFLGRHEGYSTPFDIAIPDGLVKDGENTVVLSVSNLRLEGLEGMPIVGLTSRAACEYSGGIWGDVELRVYMSPLRDVAVLIDEDLRSATARVEATREVGYRWEIVDGERILKSGEGRGDLTFDTDGLQRWSPESPKRYVLRLICGDAVLEREFGVRRLTSKGTKLYLNGEPYYLRGVCEHCYYPETVNPSHDIAFYRNVVKKLKELGFNYIRFHTYVPAEEYLQAADELGILMHVECPNNTTFEEWQEIIAFSRRHTSTVIYCCGNELQITDSVLEHLRRVADEVHGKTDALFSPMSALRGFEYCHPESEIKSGEVVEQPFRHNPRRFSIAKDFCDLYNSYTLGHHSYFSMKGEIDAVDSWSDIYGKPRLSHEICIDGTYTDLTLKARYKGTRIGKYSDMLESLERHLEEKGLLKKAPVYFRNSCQWQRRVRKYCFEMVRRGENIAGYDFLGPIDTHWHTFGYDCGMMNEFYELKPGESVRNVRMYNSATVLLTDLGRKSNFASGEQMSCAILTSCYGVKELKDSTLTVRLSMGDRVIERRRVCVDGVKGGEVTKLYDFTATLPQVDEPCAMKLSVTLDAEGLFAENEWELYLFPKAGEIDAKDLRIVNSIGESALLDAMERGERVLILGSDPFPCNGLSFRIALAGRSEGNLATVIADHPLLNRIPHEGYCGWQFESLMEGGRTVILEGEGVPFEPLIEIASSHKNARRQAALFEYKLLNGKLLVCGFNFREDDPAACWLKKQLVDYANSEDFDPAHSISREAFHALLHRYVPTSEGNANFAFNPNDKASMKKK